MSARIRSDVIATATINGCEVRWGINAHWIAEATAAYTRGDREDAATILSWYSFVEVEASVKLKPAERAKREAGVLRSLTWQPVDPWTMSLKDLLHVCVAG